MANQRFRNRGVVAQGMLAPSGYVDTHPDPFVQSTTRPAGSLLQESPGYDTIRPGRNRFQGKGPTGGFRPMEFAEDVGGSGAVLSVVPGDVEQIAATEWLPEDPDSLPEGSVIVADRSHPEGIATRLHQGLDTLTDMGDRHPDRPLSKNPWLINPVGMFRSDLQERPVYTVIATVGLVTLLSVLAHDFERQYRGYRGRGEGLASEAAAPPAAAAATGGQASGDAVEKVGNATDDAVSKIGKVADDAVSAIEKAGKDAADSIKSATKGE